MGYEVPDMPRSGEQGRGNLLHAAVAHIEMDHFWRMAVGHATLIEVLVLGDDHVAVRSREVPDIRILILCHADEQDVCTTREFLTKQPHQTAGQILIEQELHGATASSR